MVRSLGHTMDEETPTNPFFPPIGQPKRDKVKVPQRENLPTIVVIEDNLNDRRLTRRLLESAAYRVVEAEYARDGLKAISASP